MLRIKSVELVKTVYRASDILLDSIPQFAFVGRSNVGKSTLLNVLLNRRMALVSSRPGKTRSVNYFLVNKLFYFVDLPGYGFAKVPPAEKERWQKVMSAYFEKTTALYMLFCLMDARHPFVKSDRFFWEWILPYPFSKAVVLTKSDKLNGMEKKRSLEQTQQVLEEMKMQIPVFPFSSLKRIGIDPLCNFVQEMLG
ncbi:MAG TPA: ribosome biogenesis GTP-binding protein YihA/YsxC [Thermotogota bacterium]|nr:ribosome biogenesis GTP-binding protein YihA/YsxC [Thermotogota bacterium]HRW93056.1 ribosome biogenesis GTP-binding protein YihA/YsxC [Thermotogota bacterium]